MTNRFHLLAFCCGHRLVPLIYSTNQLIFLFSQSDRSVRQGVRLSVPLLSRLFLSNYWLEFNETLYKRICAYYHQSCVLAIHRGVYIASTDFLNFTATCPNLSSKHPWIHGCVGFSHLQFGNVEVINATVVDFLPKRLKRHQVIVNTCVGIVMFAAGQLFLTKVSRECVCVCTS